MAYVSGVIQQYLSGTSLLMTEIPAHNIGTLLLYIVSSNSSTTATWSGTGWAVHPDHTIVTQGGVRYYVRWKIAESDEEEPPGFTVGYTSYTTHTLLAIEDYDPDNIWGQIAAVTNTAQEQSTCATLTTTTDNELIIDCCSWYNTGTLFRPYFAPATSTKQLVNGQTGRNTCVVGERVQQVAGTTTALKAYQITKANVVSHALSLSIRNKVGGSLPIFCNSRPQKLYYEAYPGAMLNTEISASNVDLYDLASSLGIYNTVSVAFGMGTPFNPQVLSSARLFTPSVVTGSLWTGGGVHWDNPIDLTNGKALMFNWEIPDRTRLGTPAVLAFLNSSYGNYHSFYLRPIAQIESGVSYTSIIEPNSTYTAYTSGAIDWSAITDFCLCYRRTSTTNTSPRFYGIYLIDKNTPATIVGGGITNPINATNAQPVINGYDCATGAKLGGGGQIVIPAPVKFGDGEYPTYLDTRGESFELPRYVNPPKRIYEFNAGDGISGIEIEAGPNDNIYFGAGIFASANSKSYFTVTPPLSGYQHLQLDNQQIKNSIVAWCSDVPANNILFDTCDEVCANSATFTNCQFLNQSEQFAIRGQDGIKLLECEFTSPVSGSNYAVHFVGTGTLDVSDTLFNDYATDIFVDAISGDVFIKLNYGEDPPTYDTSGANVVLDILLSNTIIEAPNFLDTNTVGLYNLTQGTELDYVASLNTGSGYSKTLVPGVDYDPGDNLELRAIRVIGATATERYTLPIATSAAGGTIRTIRNLIDDKIYNDNAIDGSSVTEFSADYPNVEIDISDGDGVTSVRRLYAWWKYNLTSQSGLRYFWGGFDADDAFNYRVVTEVLDLKLENVSAIPVVITDGRIYRDDNETIIAASSNSIQIDPDKVYTVQTVSAVTSQDKEDIAIITRQKMEEFGSKMDKTEKRSRTITGLQ